MKKLLTAFVLLSLGTFCIFSSCGGGGDTQQQWADTTQKKDTLAAQFADLPADIQAMMPRGKEIYDTKCVACHQKDGKGLVNAFPPLANSDYLFADKVRAVAQTLNGSHMEIIVNGQKYNQLMPQQVDTKEDAVAVTNYVLNSFGNKGGFVSLEEVKDVKIEPRKKAEEQK
ncbi:MAG: cytochrome c [Bacteroidales bacterium]